MDMTRVKHGLSAGNVHLNGRRHSPKEPQLAGATIGGAANAVARIRCLVQNFCVRFVQSLAPSAHPCPTWLTSLGRVEAGRSTGLHQERFMFPNSFYMCPERRLSPRRRREPKVQQRQSTQHCPNEDQRHRCGHREQLRRQRVQRARTCRAKNERLGLPVQRRGAAAPMRQGLKFVDDRRVTTRLQQLLTCCSTSTKGCWRSVG